MSFADITMAILSHHPVQLLATTVLLVHLARARGFGRAAHRLYTEMGATGHAERLAKEMGR